MPLDKFSEVEGAPGLLYYDTSPGKGAPVEKGQRVAVHFDVKLGKIPAGARGRCRRSLRPIARLALAGDRACLDGTADC